MNRIHISELKYLQDHAGNYATEEAEDPTTLCANWRHGCNAGTDGADEKGFLTLCYDCNNAEGYMNAGRGGITIEKRATQPR